MVADDRLLTLLAGDDDSKLGDRLNDGTSDTGNVGQDEEEEQEEDEEMDDAVADDDALEPNDVAAAAAAADLGKSRNSCQSYPKRG